MENRKDLLEATVRFARNINEDVTDFQIRVANSLLRFPMTDDQLARIDEIINQ